MLRAFKAYLGHKNTNVQQLFRRYDSDHDGHLDCYEFKQCVLGWDQSISIDVIDQAFRSMDDGFKGDGYINFKVFSGAVRPPPKISRRVGNIVPRIRSTQRPRGGREPPYTPPGGRGSPEPNQLKSWDRASPQRSKSRTRPTKPPRMWRRKDDSAPTWVHPNAAPPKAHTYEVYVKDEPFGFKLAKDSLQVEKVHKGHAAERAGVRAGSEIVGIGYSHESYDVEKNPSLFKELVRTNCPPFRLILRKPPHSWSKDPRLQNDNAGEARHRWTLNGRPEVHELRS